MLKRFDAHDREAVDRAERFLAHFPARDDAEATIASRRVIGTRVFNWENWTWANLQVKTGRSPVYFYQFAHVPPKPPFPGRGGDLVERDIEGVLERDDCRLRDRQLGEAAAELAARFGGCGLVYRVAVGGDAQVLEQRLVAHR